MSTLPQKPAGRRQRTWNFIRREEENGNEHGRSEKEEDTVKKGRTGASIQSKASRPGSATERETAKEVEGSCGRKKSLLEGEKAFTNGSARQGEGHGGQGGGDVAVKRGGIANLIFGAAHLTPCGN